MDDASLHAYFAIHYIQEKKLKTKRYNKIYPFLLAIFFISVGFLFFNIRNVSAWADVSDYWTGVGADVIKDSGSATINWILEVILQFVGWILNLAVLLFAWAIDATSLNLIMDNTAVKETWGLIRDLCNIGFILILLFSAFATVFQYSKYNYKSILMWLVIMALLVNFSFPISRFIIDISNSLMYTLLNVEFGAYVADGGKIWTSSPAFSPLKGIIVPSAGKADTTQLLASIVFVFILALTILALSLILIIRTIALAIIIIFSPIGFVGIIVGKDGGWWGHLFKYAMAGPIIALVLLIAIRLIKATASMSLNAGGSTYGGGNLPIIASMAQFTIPIVILWMGIAMAVKGIDGAGNVLGKAHGVSKWAGKKFSGYNAIKGQYDAYSSSRKKRRDEMDKKKLGASLGDKFNNAQDATYAKVFSKKAQGRYNKRNEQSNKDDIKSASEKNDGVGTSSLITDTTSNLMMDTATRENLTKTQKLANAGKVKQLMSRGKEFETSLENNINSKDADSVIQLQEFVTKAGVAGIAPITSTTTINASDMNKIKAAYYAEARKLIKDAEDHGKKEGDPYTHKAYNAVKNKLTP